MRNRYWVIAVVALILALSTAAFGQEYLVVHSIKDCIGLLQAGGAHISLTPGDLYSVTVAGHAYSNPDHYSEYDGVYCFYYDSTRPNHPQMVYLEVGAVLEFVASDTDFYAFLADLSLKDCADNGGAMTLTFVGPARARETLVVDAVFNCLGLRDFGAAEKILIPFDHYTATVDGNAVTNGLPDGHYDGVCVWYRTPELTYCPIQGVLNVGDELDFTMNQWGWFYAFLVDESYATMGGNSGSMTVTFSQESAVEEQTWGAIKALYR